MDPSSGIEPPTSPMNDQLAALRDTVKGLENVCAKLFGRLDSILAPPVPPPATAIADVPTAADPQSSFAQQIQGVVNAVNALCATCEEITRRLEL